MLKKRTILGACAAILASTGSASAGDWFHHHFGELRAYHHDWLNVCQDNGEGQCRTVQLALEDPSVETFFGESRLAVVFRDAETQVLEFYDQGLQIDSLSDVVLDFGKEKIALTSEQWTPGGADFTNIAESFAISDPDLVAEVLGLMRKKNRLCVRYSDATQDDGLAVHSLRGVSSALRSIDARL